jgi:hypothetical protein
VNLATSPSLQRPAKRIGPPTLTQRQIWALDRRKPKPEVLNLTYALRIDGPLDLRALGGAFRDVVRRHEPLRTTYGTFDDQLVARVGDEELALAGVDLAPVLVGDPQEAAMRTAELRMRGFDLASEAPIRVCVLRLGADCHLLLLSLHHIAADGWSLRLLSTDLSRSYAARLGGGSSVQPPPTMDCIDQARWQRRWLESGDADREARWWTDFLRCASPELPGLPGQRRDSITDMRRQVMVIQEVLTAALRRLGRETGVSVFALLLTAFQGLLTRWSGLPEVVVGTLAAGRPTALSGSILGAHYNVLLLSTDFGGDPTMAECILRTAKRTVAALDRQALPYPVLAGSLERQSDWDMDRIPSAMLVLDRYPLEELRLKGCVVTGLYLDEGGPTTPIWGGGPVARIHAASVADLTFFVREAGTQFTVSALYPAERLRDSSVIALMRSYLEVLIAMGEGVEATLASVELALDGSDPDRHIHPDAPPARPGLHDISTVAPAEALSPVGRWTDPAADLC